MPVHVVTTEPPVNQQHRARLNNTNAFSAPLDHPALPVKMDQLVRRDRMDSQDRQEIPVETGLLVRQDLPATPASLELQAELVSQVLLAKMANDRAHRLDRKAPTDLPDLRERTEMPDNLEAMASPAVKAAPDKLASRAGLAKTANQVRPEAPDCRAAMQLTARARHVRRFSSHVIVSKWEDSRSLLVVFSY